MLPPGKGGHYAGTARTSEDKALDIVYLQVTHSLQRSVQMNSPRSNEALRAKFDALVQRVEHDETFAAQVKADPVGALRAVDIPPDLLAGSQGENAPVLNRYRDQECNDTTCWITQCPATCYISL